MAIPVEQVNKFFDLSSKLNSLLSSTVNNNSFANIFCIREREFKLSLRICMYFLKSSLDLISYKHSLSVSSISILQGYVILTYCTNCTYKRSLELESGYNKGRQIEYDCRYIERCMDYNILHCHFLINIWTWWRNKIRYIAASRQPFLMLTKMPLLIQPSLQLLTRMYKCHVGWTWIRNRPLSTVIYITLYTLCLFYAY